MSSASGPTCAIRWPANTSPASTSRPSVAATAPLRMAKPTCAASSSATASSGTATVIARDDQNRYAFYRGKTPLGNAVPNKPSQPTPKGEAKQNLNYQQTSRCKTASSNGNWKGYDTFRRGSNKGVQIQQVR